MKKNIVIVGLGLIGGSMARALRGFEDFDVVGVDVSQPTLRYALEQGVVDRTEEDPVRALAQGDLVFLCLHPQGILDFMDRHREHFKKGAMVTDVCGVKGAAGEIVLDHRAPPSVRAWAWKARASSRRRQARHSSSFPTSAAAGPPTLFRTRRA